MHRVLGDDVVVERALGRASLGDALDLRGQHRVAVFIGSDARVELAHGEVDVAQAVVHGCLECVQWGQGQSLEVTRNLVLDHGVTVDGNA